MKILITILVIAVLGLGTFLGFSKVEEQKLGAIAVFSTRQGGTGTSSTPSSGSLLVGNASGTYDVTSTITNLNLVNVTSTNLALTGFTNGSILFTTSSGQISQNNSNLYWDNVNGRLGVGATSPSQKLDVSAAMGNGAIPLLASTISDTTRNLHLTSGILSTAGYDLAGFWFTGSTPTALNQNFGIDSSGNDYFNVPTGAMQYFSINNTYYANLNTNGFSINNGSTGNISGVGLVVGSGKVGIGTTTPASNLSVSGTVFINGRLTLPWQGDNTQPEIVIGNDSGIGITRINGNASLGIMAGAGTISAQFTQSGVTVSGLGIQNSTNVEAGGFSMTTGQIAWGPNTTMDVGFSRISTNTVAAGTGTKQSTGGTLIANKIGIGTTVPSSTLHIVPTAGTTPLSISSSTLASLMFIDTMGNVGINTSSPQYKLAVSGTVQLWNLTQSAALQTAVLCTNAVGEVIADSVACLASSRKVKKEIQPLTKGIDEIMLLRPVSFKYKDSFLGGRKDNPNFNGTQYSLIAEDVQKVDSNLVSVKTSGKEKGEADGLQSLNNWIGLFVKSLQDIEKQVIALFDWKSDAEERMQKLESAVRLQQQEINLLNAKLKAITK